MFISKESSANSSRIPVFISVTGHRELRPGSEDGLKSAVKKAVNEIRGISAGKSRYQYTDFILLTSLLPGAAQLATQAVIELAEEEKRKTGTSTISFAVVLPMEKSTYYSTASFSTQECIAADEFIENEHCAFTYVLPEQCEKNVGEDNHNALQLRECSRFMSDSSIAVIALWDGIGNYDSPAGADKTNLTVRDILHGKTYHRWKFGYITMPETRPVHHIYTPRVGSEPSEEFDYKTRRLFPEPYLETGDSWFTLDNRTNTQIKKLFDLDKRSRTTREREAAVTERLEDINRYNKDISHFSVCATDDLNTTLKKWQSNSVDGGTSYENGKLLNPGKNAEICEKYYVGADTLSQKYKIKRKRSILLIVWIAGIAYGCMNAFSDILATPWFLLLYFVMLVAAVVVYLSVKNGKYHDRYVDYRALAEGMRVQYYWYAADICGGADNASITKAADIQQNDPALVQDYYLRKQQGQLGWVRQAIRSINILAAVAQGSSKCSVDITTLKNVADIWLGRMDIKRGEKWYNPTYNLRGNGQVGFYRAKSLTSLEDINLVKRPRSENGSRDDRRNYRKQLKKDKLTLCAEYKKHRLLTRLTYFCIAASMLMAATIMTCLFLIPENALVQDYTDLCVFVTGLLPVFAMVFSEIEDQMGYEEDVVRNSWYHKVLKRAILEVDRADGDNKEDELREVLFEIGKETLRENADWVAINEKRRPEIPSN